MGMKSSPKMFSDEEEQKFLEELLSEPIILCERIRELHNYSSLSFKFECFEVSKHVDLLSQMLRSIVCFAKANSSLIYDRPIRRICLEVSRTLLRAHTLLRKCHRRRNFIHRLINLVTAADFRKLFTLLEASAADLRWLISVFRIEELNITEDGDDYEGEGYDVVLSLPPIASNDPILAWVWSYTATLQMGSSLLGRVGAAREISSLARDSDRTKKLIVEEGGVLPLLRLLKEGSSAEGQVAAAVALFNVGNDGERVRVIVECMGVPLIAQVLADSAMRVQVKLAELVGRMAEFDDGGVAKEEFGRENVICTLVSLLSFETFEVEVSSKKIGSIHSLVQVSKEKKRGESLKPRLSSSYSSSSSAEGGGSSKGRQQTRKERENESAEVKEELKVSCAKALWMLAKGSVSNSSRITETKGLLCLAKLIEKEKDSGVLRKNCVMAIMEITRAAESNADLRRSAFKTNSPVAKAVVEQLLRVIKESSDVNLQISAVRSIGFLSRTFSARETRVIEHLVKQLSNSNLEIATEAAIALVKFVDPENFLCQEHSRAVIGFGGVSSLMRLLRANEKNLVYGLILLCHLSINVSDNEALEQAQAMVLNTLKGAAANESLIAQHPQLKELIAKAIYHLGLYLGDSNLLRQSSLRIYDRKIIT